MSEEQQNQSNIPYDDTFRTMVAKGGNLRIPFLNEMFHLKDPIPPDAHIENVANEIFIEGGNGKQKKVISDTRLHVKRRSFHVECESGDDGTILVRMFEYDVNIGIQEHDFHNNNLLIKIPYSGVLFLRKSSEKTEPMTVTIEARGKQLVFPVDAIYLKDYSLKDLIEKDLLFLFPFYMFNLEKEFRLYEKNDEKARKKVIDTLNELIEYVNDLYRDKKLTYEKYLLITDMLKKVTLALARKYEHVRKELDDIMGGKILEFKGERIYNEGKVSELVELVHDGDLGFDIAAKKAEQKYGITRDAFQEMVDHYQPDSEDLMQG